MSFDFLKMEWREREHEANDLDALVDPTTL